MRPSLLTVGACRLSCYAASQMNVHYESSWLHGPIALIACSALLTAVSSCGNDDEPSESVAADEAHTNSDAGDARAEAGSTEGGVSDPRCSVVNLGLVDDCPDGSMCIQTDYVDGEGFFECMDTCTAPQDCDADRECYDYSNTGSPVCGPARKSCDVTADADSCTCDFDDGTRRPILLVRGTGDDCEVVEAERTACYWMFGDCLEDCTPRFYRYDFGDGTALVAAPGNGELPPGWTVDSRKGALAPDSCPEVYGYYDFE